MIEKDYYKKEIINMVNSIDSLNVLEFLYNFLKNNLPNWR